MGGALGSSRRRQTFLAIEAAGWELRGHSPGSAFLVRSLSRRARIANARPDLSETSKQIDLG